jgi:hypothetical protein
MKIKIDSLLIEKYLKKIEVVFGTLSLEKYNLLERVLEDFYEEVYSNAFEDGEDYRIMDGFHYKK